MIKKFKHVTLVESALLVSLLHLIFLIVIQIENFLFYISPLPNNQQNLLAYIGELTFDNIAVALFLGMLTLFLSSHVLLKVCLYIFILILNLYLVIDQLAFKVFFDHLRVDLLEGTAGLDVLISSMLAEIDLAFYINTALFIVFSGLIFMTMFFGKKKLTEFTLPRFSVLVLSLLYIVLSTTSDQLVLGQHPIVSMFKTNGEILETDSVGDDIDFYQSRFDAIVDTKAVEAAIRDVEKNISVNPVKPNIVLIVLESVGSQQLLTNDGLPSKKITPTISELAKNSIIFDAMYSVYPATVLSHVSMNTGGPAITIGNVHKDLSYTYRGLTLNKGLSALGYKTALFSSQKLDYGNMAGFYEKLKYDKYFDFGEASEQFQKNNALHSWGGEELAVMNEAIAWIDEVSKSHEPFFLQYLSNATHHPYTVPENFKTIVESESRFSAYQNSLAYTDQVIKALVDYLRSNRLLENTVIAIVGDHGEAFGVKHEKNMTHKNYLYEENVKNFLLVSNTQFIQKSAISHKIATIGDVMPTLLSFAKAPKTFLPAQNLLSKNTESRIAYFHKNSPPNLWGLRDGRWKYIDTRLGSNAQLYDLNLDPNESMNVADLHADKIQVYRSLVSKWYVSSNNLFLSKLEAYRPVGGVLPDEDQLQKPGPRGITLGYQKGNRFVETNDLSNKNRVLVWVSWVSYPESKALLFRWSSPSGKVYEEKSFVHPGWADAIKKHPLQSDLETGSWEFAIYDGSEKLMAQKFIIRRE